MPNVVGTLTVNLEASTASFSGDLGKAAKSAEDFGKTASAAGERVEFSMMEARGGLAMMGEEVGVRIPRHLQTLIATIPGVGTAFATMLPLIGVIAAIGIIEKLIEKHKEAAKELAESIGAVDVAVEKSGANTRIELLKLSKEFDDLTGNHAKALVDEIELLDAITLKQLGTELEGLAKLGDKVFASMQKAETSFWFGGQWNSAAAQVKTDLDAFNTKLELLVHTGTKADVAVAVVQHLADVTKELNKEQGLQSTQTGHKDRVEALKQELTLAQALAKEYAEADAVEGAHKKVEAAKEGIKIAKQEAEEFKKSSEIMHRAMEERKKDAIEAAKSAEQLNKIVEELDRDIAKEKEKAGKEWLKIQARIGEEERKQAEMIAKLEAAGEIEAARHSIALHQATAREAADVEAQAVQKMTQIDVTALDKEIQRLDKHDAEYLLKLKKFEDAKAQVILKGELEATKIRNTAEQVLFQESQKALERSSDAVAKTAARNIASGKDMAAAFAQMGTQMLESAAENVIKMALLQDVKKLRDAKSAASSTYAHVMETVPPPYAFPLAIAEGAMAFAGVMSFEHGGRIPGSGPVPIMAHGGEHVLTKAQVDRGEASERRGGRQQPSIVLNIHGIKDADGFKKSQTQIAAHAHHAAEVAARKNR
jgi:hypothetical protein